MAKYPTIIFYSLLAALVFSSCGTCDTEGEPDKVYEASAENKRWIPEDVTDTFTLTSNPNLTETWIRTVNSIVDSFYLFCSKKKVIHSRYIRHTFQSTAGKILKIEVAGGLAGDELWVELDSIPAAYNFDTGDSMRLGTNTGQLSSGFTYHNNLTLGATNWTGVYEIGIKEISRLLFSSEPARIFVTKQQGLVRYIRKDGTVWTR